ncbi:hypothetical protein BGX38DRAFT_1249365 [Terfezia claveryi]|nr:hypothetical protein BGX38DRAFT_1249365 [Terfezia claveryi]
MAVMTTIQQDQNKPTGGAYLDEATAMDLDVNGTTKQVDSFATQNPATLSSSSNEKDNVDSVNGNPKGVNAPPSPPIPTPPLHISVDRAQDLSDLHITSPTPGAQTKRVPNLGSSPQPDEETISPGTKMEMDDDPISPLTSAPRSTTGSGANPTPEATKSQRPTVSTDHEMVDAPTSLVKTGREREEEDDEESQERPSKRAKTDELENKPLMSQASTSTGPMPKVQAKHALQTIRTIRRTKDAGPFLVPVDPVKLAIPTYFDYVKNPMDLSTMEKKLQSDQYATVEDFVKDFKLIISNCLTFNGVEHKISDMARGIEATFERQMKNMPAPDQPEPPEKKSHKKGSNSKSGGSKPKPAAAPKAASPPDPLPPPPPPPPPPPVTSPVAPKSATVKSKATKAPRREAKTTQSQTFALDPSGMPTIRRESVQSDGRPKREIHPPPPRDLPYSDVKPRRKKTAAELKFCDQVMKELQKKQHEAYAYPFYTPVDPVALNIPDYFRIIKKPMDFSTMQNKLKTNQYDNANEFEADMRLMLSNCYKFNPNGTAVHAMGRKLEEVFNKKWAEKTAFIQSQSGSRSPVSASPPPDDEGEMSGEEDPQMEILQKQLEVMQKQLEAMKGKKKSPPAQAQGGKKGKAGGSAAGRKGSISQPASQRKKAMKKVEEVPLLSMEEKTELSQRINLLSPNKMLYATKLIQDNLPNLSGDDEIELDIDDLPPEILYKLHKYVTKHAPLAPQNTEYGYSAPPAPAAVPKPKAAPRPKKNKPMSATEQEAKIKDLNAKLAVFENPQNANQSTSEAVEAQEEEESSSDDESSNSESEEE